MALPSVYNQGTASVAMNGTTVTGEGTGWLTALRAGDQFWAAGLSVRIDDVLSHTELILAHSWPGADLNEAAYEVAFVSDAARVQESVRQLLERLVNAQLLVPDAIGSLEDRADHDSARAGFIFLQVDVSPAVLFFKLTDAAGDWSLGSPLAGAPGPAGTSFKVDATGPFSERAEYGDEPPGFSFLATDMGELYIREGEVGWSDGIAFGRGDDGRPAEFQATEDELQWRLVDDPVWLSLLPLSAISARQVEIGRSLIHIGWRYVGEEEFIPLVALADLEGADGREVELGTNATHIVWRFAGDAGWIDLVALADLKGADGREVEMSVSATHLTWRYAGEEDWRDLIAIEDLEASVTRAAVKAASGALLDEEGQVLTGGAIVESKLLPDATGASLVLNPGGRPIQHYLNDGAFTLAPGINHGTLILDIENGADAGPITMTGWAKPPTGDSFDIMPGHKFRCHCSIGPAGAFLFIEAAQ